MNPFDIFRVCFFSHFPYFLSQIESLHAISAIFDYFYQFQFIRVDDLLYLVSKTQAKLRSFFL